MAKSTKKLTVKKTFCEKTKTGNEMQQYADQSAHIALQDHKKNFMIF